MLQLNPKINEVAEAIEESSSEDRQQLLSILPKLAVFAFVSVHLITPPVQRSRRQ
jgi:hypothetical protein